MMKNSTKCVCSSNIIYPDPWRVQYVQVDGRINKRYLVLQIQIYKFVRFINYVNL